MNATTERSTLLMTGAFLMILAILSAMGSISLGTYQVPISRGGTTSDFLITDYLFVLLAFGFVALGALFFYRSGEVSVQIKKPKTQ